MAINKNFVVRNGFEVSTDLILANSDTRRVGIARTNPQYTLDVAGGIGATDFYLTGVGTFANELNVGSNGSVLTVLGLGNSIGIGTALPQYLLDIRSPVSTGQTALYVQGDVRITGDLNIDDINLDNATIQDLNVTGITTVGFITASNLYVAGVGTFLSSGLKIRNVANTFQYSITGGAITADRTLNLPVITGTDTVATLGLTQTFSGINTFSSTLSASSTLSLTGSTTGIHSFGTNQTSGTLTFGGTSGTGTITLGRATTSQTTGIQTGVTASGNQKTINLGTGGASGSRTLITVGSATAGAISTVAINPGTNLILGLTTATPTGTTLQPLQVGSASSVQGAYISGSVGIGTTNPGATLNVVPTSPSIAGLFSGTTSSDMVRITQLGTGNALVVEDSANHDASPFVVNASGSVGIGTTNPVSYLDIYGGSYGEAYIRGDNGSELYFQVSRGDANSHSSYIGQTYDGYTSLFAYPNGSSSNYNLIFEYHYPSKTSRFQAGQVDVIKLFGDGDGTYGRACVIGDSNSLTRTTTPNQVLQVTGGAYVSGSVGIGTTNPTSKLSVVGDGIFTGVVTATTFVGTAGTITNFNSTNGTITNITGTAGTITTLNSTSGTITNITGTAGTITTLNSTSGTITNLTGTAGTITNFNSTNGTITTLNSTSGTITNLTGTAGTITNFNSTSGTITNLTGTAGTITNFNSTNGTITTLNSTSGTITNLTGTAGTITNFNSTNGTITNLTGTAGTITTLNSTNGTITNLTGTGVTYTNGTITNLTGTGVTYTNGTITNLTGTAGTITSLNSTSGTITNLTSTQLNVSGITTLGVTTATNLTSQQLNVSGITTVGFITATNLQVSGIVTARNGIQGIGIQSGGLNVAVGVITALNFIGLGNTFSYNSTTVDISIGGGNWNYSNTSDLNGSIYRLSNVGIGTTNPTSKLQVQGDAFITGVTTSTDFNSTSDINLKTNIQQIDNSLAKVIQIRGVTFDWKDSNRSSAGVIAQEVEKVLPELVNGNSPKTVNYNGIIAVLIEAVKELKKEIEELKSTK